MLHNALNQIKIPLESETLQGFSISGLATYLQIPELNICFDMGECPLSAVPMNHVFLTHAHGDHARCLMRHHSLRGMMNIEKRAVYYLPSFLVEPAKNWIHAEALFEGVRPDRVEFPDIVGLAPQDELQPLKHRKDLMVSSFRVSHGIPSLAYTIFDQRKKLKKKYLGLSGREIVALKNAGTILENQTFHPRITFIGDCKGRSLFEEEHIWKSRILVLECTFLAEGEENMARKKGHTHLKEIVRALQSFEHTMACETIVLKHFSMKYSRRQIEEQVAQAIPRQFRDKIRLLI